MNFWTHLLKYYKIFPFFSDFLFLLLYIFKIFTFKPAIILLQDSKTCYNKKKKEKRA